MSYERDIEAATTQLQSLLAKNGVELKRIADDTIKVCERLEKSWSGSWIGYHANLYFGEYQAPGTGQMFSIEWGGLNGYDPRWQSRSLEEVWSHVINNSSIKFDISKADEKLKEIQEAADGLKTLYELNSDNSVLAKKIKDIDTDFTMHDFIKTRSPKNIVSRDSEAVYQGIKLPPHIQCQSFAYTLRQNISAAEKLIKLKPLVVGSKELPAVVQLLDDELSHLNPKLVEKVGKLYRDKHYTEAVGKAFSVVKDRLREISGFENGYPAFEEGGLSIKGAAAENVDEDFQEAVKRLLGAIDKFRNEKFHTSEADLREREKALSYLHICSLALSFLSDGTYSISRKPKKKP